MAIYTDGSKTTDSVPTAATRTGFNAQVTLPGIAT